MDVLSRLDDAYAKPFSNLDKGEVGGFIAQLEGRLKVNNIDPVELFEGRSCLDAGCGSGRGAIMMALNGANKVVARDISELNLLTVRKNAKLFRVHDKIDYSCGSIESIDVDNESIDFVWCNGVVHHTTNPTACLRELSKVLKVGGRMWLYLYGAGGLKYKMVDIFRECIPPDRESIESILYQESNHQTAYYLDNICTPIIERYNWLDIYYALAFLGFGDCIPLKRGLPYDASERLFCNYISDVPYIGEGDLRYLCTKEVQPLSGEFGKSISNITTYTKEVETFFNSMDFEDRLNKMDLGSKVKASFDLMFYLQDQYKKINRSLDMIKIKIYFSKALDRVWI